VQDYATVLLAILPPFLIAATLIELTPGPNMAYLAHVALERGRAAGLAVVAGVALGLLIIGVLASVGVGALVEASPLAWQGLRLAGTAYLFWLAWDAWRNADQEEDTGSGSTSTILLFRRGLITNLLNPKAAVFYVAMLPQFTRPDLGGMPVQLAALTVAFVMVATTIHATVVILAASARVWLAKSGQVVLVRRILALALAGVAVWFLLGTAR
jgi:threonine/homoserine/homoserine lactone efflux protein